MGKSGQRTSWTDPITDYTATRQNLPHIQAPGNSYFTASNSWERSLLSPEARDITLDTIMHHNNSKYHLDAAVVMPDHFHLILKPLPKGSAGDFSLSEIFQSIKSYSAKKILAKPDASDYRTRKRVVWQDENYDHLIRNEQDYREKLHYLLNNPIEAGLVQRSEDYRWLYCPAIGKGW